MGETPSRPSGKTDFMNTSPYPRQRQSDEPYMHQNNYPPEMGRSVLTIKPAYAKISSDAKKETDNANFEKNPTKH